jgi:CHAD domain-containing protein
MSPTTLDAFLRPSGTLNEPTRTSSGCRSLFGRIAKSCIRAIVTNRQSAIAGDGDAIHTMRIALTKLRAAALFFKPWVAEVEWQKINSELRWLNKVLGNARDWDVTIEYIERAHHRRRARKSWHTALRSHDEAHHRLAKTLRSDRYRRLAEALNCWLDKHYGSGNEPSPHGDNDYCETCLRDWREKLIKNEQRVSVLKRKQLHRFRIRSKYYRYMVDSLIDLGMTVSRDDFTFYEIVRRLHRDIGELRDLRRFRKYVGKHSLQYRKRRRELMSRVKQSFRQY